MENDVVNNKTNNALGLSQEEIAMMKQKLAIEKQQTERKKKLDGMLNGENGEIYKELYSKHGLKEMIDSDPEILDSEAALRVAIGTAKNRYQVAQAQQEEKKKEEIPAQKESAPLNPTQTQPKANTEDEKLNLKSMSLDEIVKVSNGKLSRGDALLAKIFG